MPLDSVLTDDLPTFVTHLECSLTGKRYEADRVHGLSEAGRPLWVRYDLEALGRAVSKEALAVRRSGGFWRYREFLPVRRAENVVSLGEVTTPLIALPRLAGQLGLGGGEIIVKDEGRLPTASFKARGLALAVAMAKELGLTYLAIPTAGNAGAAMAAYASRAGLRSTVLCPDDAPGIAMSETEIQGASVYKVNGLINDCAKIVGDGKAAAGWFDCSTLKEPYRLEGKKTMGLELAEQFDWKLPDVVLYPTGGGTGLIGMWKAFHELRELGWLKQETFPRMVAVQSDGCAPIIRAYEKGERFAVPWENAATCASGLRVPSAVGDFMILDAIRQSGGCAVAAAESRIVESQKSVMATEGIALCPEAATCVLAIEALLRDGWMKPDDRVVLFNKGAATKYIEHIPLELETITDPKSVDYGLFA